MKNLDRAREKNSCRYYYYHYYYISVGNGVQDCPTFWYSRISMWYYKGRFYRESLS